MLVAAAALITTIHALHQQSFCISEMRFTTDEEKMSAAALEAFQWNNSMAKSKMEERPLPYSSIEEFQTLNPNCCEVVTDQMRSGPLKLEFSRPGFMEYLTGLKVGEVVVSYIERRLNRDGSQLTESKLRVMPVSSCARVIID